MGTCALFKPGPARPESSCTTISKAPCWNAAAIRFISTRGCWNWQRTITSPHVLARYAREIKKAILQCTIVAGGVAAGDILSTTINGATVAYPVTGAEANLSALAANIATAVNANAVASAVVNANTLGGIVIFRAKGSSGFTLTSSTSPNASASYTTGPQFPAWQATISGGFLTGDMLTTDINDASLTYTIGPADTTPAGIATKIVSQINSSSVIDPVTGLSVNGLVVASASNGIITFLSAGPAFVMSCSVSPSASEIYRIAGEFPARPGGGPIAGIWSGYLNAPQDGFYNIAIETDPGAAVTLTIDGDAVLLAPSPNASVWSNQSPISLTAGELVPIEITASSLNSSLALTWQSSGLGVQDIPHANLYSDTLMDHLQTAYIRFLKASSLATNLSLTADEITYLGTSANYAVNTTDSADTIPAGSVTLTPASMENISPGSMLVLDTGDAQEVVLVIATTATTFTTVTQKPHNGKTTPFPIVDWPVGGTGQGWLNLLNVSPIASSSTAPLYPPSTYTAGVQTFASQTATIGGTAKTNDVLITTINGVATQYTVAASDSSLAILAGDVAAAINANTTKDPKSGSPLNQVVCASSSGAVITINALIFGPNFALSCSTSAGATETYTAGPATTASQTATISGVFPVDSVLVATINSVTVQYTVMPADTTAAALAAKVVIAINAATTLDSVSNLPLNSLVKASNAGGVITISTSASGAPVALSCSVASLRGVLRDLLNFARMKAAISPNDERLLDVVERPTLMSTDGVTPQIVKLTGWAYTSLNSLLQHFFGTTQLSNLSSVERLRQVFDAFAFVTSCRISAGALLAATTNAPTPTTVASLQSALRALYAASDWLNVIKPINDATRIQQRDALVAYILQQLGDQYANSLITLQTNADAPAGSTNLSFASTTGVQQNMGIQGMNIPPNDAVASVGAATVSLSVALAADVPSGTSVVFVPVNASNISTPDDLYEFFLIDVETQPPVETSRIRLALSSVQLFIERILRNLEPQVFPTDIDGSLWTWMKRYRVWQANREVFLWPENWLYPELRDDQSPIFKQMMSALLQSDMTEDAAESAYLDYLSNLELVAKLEPCGLFYVPAGGDSDEASYVVARTPGAHRKYYFRQKQYGSWSPWEEIKVDCEDMPITPIVWNGRLMLFWLKIQKTTIPPMPQTTGFTNGHNSSQNVTSLTLDDLASFGAAGAGQQTRNNITISAVLCWSEYYNGKWQPQKSSDVNSPASLGSALFDTTGPNCFDVIRNLITITPVNASAGIVPSDALILSIITPVQASLSGGFIMYNTHSLPVRWEDMTMIVQDGLNTLGFPFSSYVLPPAPWRQFQPVTTYTGGTTNDTFSASYWSITGSFVYQGDILGLNRVPRIVDAAPNTAGWHSPFFFEDRRNVFYVETVEPWIPFRFSSNYGIVASSIYTVSTPNLPPLVLNSPPPVVPITPFANGYVAGGGDPAAAAQFVSQNQTIRAALGSVTSVVYQGAKLYPTGQAPAQPATTRPLFGIGPKRSSLLHIDNVTEITNLVTGFHNAADLGEIYGAETPAALQSIGIWQTHVFNYTFHNFWHPLVGELIQKLNQTSIAGMLDPAFLSGLADADGSWFWSDYNQATDSVNVATEPRDIDVQIGGPYANYNHELIYHIPVMMAVNHSNNGRFAEAQKMFHLVFDPTSTDTSVPPPMRYWKCLAFRNNQPILDINSLLQLLSTPGNQLNAEQPAVKTAVLQGYNAMLQDPFQPFVVARSRPSAFQWYVVMKYLDNLIAWGDSLFLQDTIETINEATLCYVVAANILGPRPQQMPSQTASTARNFLQLKQAGLDAMANAFVNLESQFPFNQMPTVTVNGGDSDQTGALFGMVRSLYFCVPTNTQLLAYWDTVADRLFKIRNSENIQGIFQQLPLFDPPLDPGMLVKAAAAGIDIGSIVSGLNQPIGPVRSPLLIQKSLEIAAEVRSLGNALLSAFEKGDAEQLTLLRQGHEIQLQQLVQNSRYLQWKHAQETTNGLLKTRDTAVERYTYYLRLLGLTPDSTTVPPTLSLNRVELTEDNFDDTYSSLIGQYSQPVALQSYPPLRLAQGSSPSNQAGASGSGQLYLNTNEDDELNRHLPTARDTRLAASVANAAAPILNLIPAIYVDLQYWGLGAHTKVFGGDWAASAAKAVAEGLQIIATYEQDQAGISSRTASYQRRADEWLLNANLAARELMQIGEQLIASLIAEQVAYHDYTTTKTQVQQAQQIQAFLQNKFTSAVFYNWMQSDIAGLYYQYYRFACDTARKAEQTMKRELMRPELDSTQFIQFNYWDTGHQGLLSGEALYLDIKRMEMAYHDNNKRELELTRHVSLRQLDPLAIVNLRITGSCSVSVPEWLFDRDCPGHYLRRIKTVSLSIPSVVGSMSTKH